MQTEVLSKRIIEFYDKFSSWENEVVRDKKITLTQMHTIEVLGSNGNLRMKELAGKMGITTGTLTVNMDKLEKMNLVKRVPNENDKRSTLIHLTKEGEILYKEHHDLHRKLTEDMQSTLTQTEIQHFLSILDKILCSF